MGVILTGKLICKTDEELARVKGAVARHIELTRAEPGCISFTVVQTADPMIWQVDEEFVDRAAFAAHQARAQASDWARASQGIERDYQITGMS